MLWLVMKNSSYQIASSNIVKKDGVHEIWVERTSGKGLKIFKSKNEEEVTEIKDAIDYAISKGKPTLELDF